MLGWTRPATAVGIGLPRRTATERVRTMSSACHSSPSGSASMGRSSRYRPARTCPGAASSGGGREGDTDDARADMRADDSADVAHQGLVARDHAVEEVEELLEVWCFGVHDSHAI